MMTVQILFFGLLRDHAGAGPVTMELPEGSTVADLREAVLGRWPSLRAWESSLLVAVNLRYAVPGDPVPPGAEVAIMPPVQGG
jgi:molybdopterin converting factor small subunit